TPSGCGPRSPSPPSAPAAASSASGPSSCRWWPRPSVAAAPGLGPRVELARARDAEPDRDVHEDAAGEVHQQPRVDVKRPVPYLGKEEQVVDRVADRDRDGEFDQAAGRHRTAFGTDAAPGLVR